MGVNRNIYISVSQPYLPSSTLNINLLVPLNANGAELMHKQGRLQPRAP